jgi:hypothetical protein
MMHGVKTDKYIMSLYAEEERTRAARKAAKYADGDKKSALAKLWHRRLMGRSARLSGWGQKLEGPKV